MQPPPESFRAHWTTLVIDRVYIMVAALFLAIELSVAWTNRFWPLFWLLIAFVVLLGLLVAWTYRRQKWLRNGALVLSLGLLGGGLIIIDRYGHYEYVVWMFLYIPLALGLAGYRRGRWWILAYLCVITGWLIFGDTSIPAPLIRETLLAFAIVLIFSSAWQIHTEIARRQLQLSNEQLDRLARTDELTGLLNRRAIEEQLRYELRRLERHPGPLSVIVIDLDQFKAINDRHGHLAGDAVLRAIGHEIRHRLRNTDIAARWGGDEFLIVLPGADEATCKRILHRLRERVMELVGPGGEPPEFSAGCATTTHPCSPDELISRADTQLYQQKTMRHSA